MDIRRQRSWMYNRRIPCKRALTDAFKTGVEEFMHFACQQPLTDNGKIRCPCFKCKNLKFLEPDLVKVHLHEKGFKPEYWYWTCHGENIPNSSGTSNTHPSSTQVSAPINFASPTTSPPSEPNLIPTAHPLPQPISVSTTKPPPRQASPTEASSQPDTTPNTSESSKRKRRPTEAVSTALRLKIKRTVVEVEPPEAQPSAAVSVTSSFKAPYEEPSQCFTSSLASHPMGSCSSIAEHIEKLEQAFSEGFPEDPNVAEALKISMLRVAKCTDESLVPPSLRSACTRLRTYFPAIACKYQVHKEMMDRSSADMAKLTNLIAKQSSFQHECEIIAKDREESIQKRDKMKAKMEALQAELARIQSEMDKLLPQIVTTEIKVESAEEAQQKLYAESAKMDANIEYLLQQREFLEQDLQTGEAGLEDVSKAWSELADLFAKARRDEAEPEKSQRPPSATQNLINF